MTIVDASGRSLDITGTVKVYVSYQALDGRRKLVEAAVLRGNRTDREILISLQLLKTWNLIHETFPHEDIYTFYNRTNKNHSAYSTHYSSNPMKSNEIYEKEGNNSELKEPSKGCKELREKLVKRFQKKLCAIEYPFAQESNGGGWEVFLDTIIGGGIQSSEGDHGNTNQVITI